MCAIAPSMSGTAARGHCATPSKRATPCRANCAARPDCDAWSTLTPKPSTPVMAAYALAVLATQTRTRGGSIETEENAEAVKPKGPSGECPATMTTPLANRESASRNASADTAEGMGAQD